MAEAYAALQANGWQSIATGVQELLARLFPDRFERSSHLVELADSGEADLGERSRAWDEFRRAFEGLGIDRIGDQEFSLVNRARALVSAVIARDARSRPASFSACLGSSSARERPKASS